jgi:transaldolase
MRQYELARDAVWRGAKRRKTLDQFKSVYSIFVSRIDQYTLEQHKGLSSAAQGQYGILNAKRIWQANQAFWAKNKTPLEQEIIFASTGTKNPADPAWKYVSALAGSDIQTNPPETNQAVASSQQSFAFFSRYRLFGERRMSTPARLTVLKSAERGQPIPSVASLHLDQARERNGE